MDDWTEEADPVMTPPVLSRSVSGRAGADSAAVAALARRLEEAKNPALVAGPDIDASGAWDVAIQLAEKQKLPVWATPAPGGGRIGFPESHPLFRGLLAPAIGPVGQMLEPYDLVVVVGSSVFPYYPYIAGAPLLEGTALVAITNDPDEAARAPMGDALVADVRLTLEALVAEVGETAREAPEELGGTEPAEVTDPLSGAGVHDVLASLMPDDGIAVVESPSSTMALRTRLRLSKPGSYYFSSAGGLGFGLAASIGVQLAQPERQVMCVLGEGSAQYAITGFWTAAAYKVPVKFLILNNSEYAILKWFAGVEQVEGAPGLDLPALDVAAVASGYGVQSAHAASRDELHAALSDAFDADGRPGCRSFDAARAGHQAHRPPGGPARAGPRARQPGRRHAGAAALGPDAAARRGPGPRAGVGPDPLRLGREPLSTVPAGGGDGA
jgi:benzoylformate decarboxylase